MYVFTLALRKYNQMNIMKAQPMKEINGLIGEKNTD